MELGHENPRFLTDTDGIIIPDDFTDGFDESVSV
jgi:hypothetical protein